MLGLLGQFSGLFLEEHQIGGSVSIGMMSSCSWRVCMFSCSRRQARPTTIIQCRRAVRLCWRCNCKTRSEKLFQLNRLVADAETRKCSGSASRAELRRSRAAARSRPALICCSRAAARSRPALICCSMETMSNSSLQRGLFTSLRLVLTCMLCMQCSGSLSIVRKYCRFFLVSTAWMQL